VGEGRDSYNSLMLTPPAALEAILFAAGEPVEKKRLAQMLEISVADLSLAIVAFEASLASRGLALINTDEEIELRTAPEAAELVKKLWESERGVTSARRASRPSRSSPIKRERREGTLTGCAE